MEQQESLEKTYHDYYPLLFAIAYRMLGSASDGKVVLDVFIPICYHSSSTLTTEERFGGFPSEGLGVKMLPCSSSNNGRASVESGHPERNLA